MTNTTIQTKILYYKYYNSNLYIMWQIVLLKTINLLHGTIQNY